MYYETDRVLLFISWILCYSFFTDVGNVFKLVIFFKCFLFCYGLFRFRKCWKLFSRRLPVIYTVLFEQHLEEPKVSDNGWLVRFRNSWSNCSLCEESKKRSKQVFYPPETGLTGCLYSSLFSWVHPVQNTGKVLFSEKEKRCIINLVSFYWTRPLYFDSP